MNWIGWSRWVECAATHRGAVRASKQQFSALRGTGQTFLVMSGDRWDPVARRQSAESEGNDKHVLLGALHSIVLR